MRAAEGVAEVERIRIIREIQDANAHGPAAPSSCDSGPSRERTIQPLRRATRHAVWKDDRCAEEDVRVRIITNMARPIRRVEPERSRKPVIDADLPCRLAFRLELGATSTPPDLRMVTERVPLLMTPGANARVAVAERNDSRKPAASSRRRANMYATPTRGLHCDAATSRFVRSNRTPKSTVRQPFARIRSWV